MSTKTENVETSVAAKTDRNADRERADKIIADAVNAGKTRVYRAHETAASINAKIPAYTASKSRVYAVFFGRWCGALAGGAIDPRDPVAMAELAVAADATHTRRSHRGWVGNWVGKCARIGAAATGTDGCPKPFTANGPFPAFHAMDVDAMKTAFVDTFGKRPTFKTKSPEPATTDEQPVETETVDA